MTNKYISRIIDTDVLAVGGSGAGVSAAIYASEKGAKVTLVSKGKIGYSGNAIMAGGGFGIDGYQAYHILGIKEADPTFTPDRMFECVVKESYYLADQNMVEQYVYEAPQVIKRFLEWAARGGQHFNFYLPAGWQSAGLSWGRTTLQGLKEHPEIQVLEDTSIVEVLVRDNTVTGALGVNIYTGELILINCKAVVLGTGGFQPFSMKNTVSDMTGDGIGMALRAGAEVADMEFLLAFPTAVIPHEMKGSIYPFIFEFFMRNLKYQIRDKNGDLIDIPEEIIKISRGGKLSKLVNSYYWSYKFDEGLAGPNGGVFYDYSENSKEVKDNSFEVYNKLFGRWHKKDHYKGESLEEVKQMIYNNELLEVGLGFEYSMGGILVNEKMETGVQGLFAAGEVTSGVFGACRAGDGLTEMLCHGSRAGISAAEYLKQAPGLANDPDTVDNKIAHLLSFFERPAGISPVQVHHLIENAADSGFNILRNEKGLERSLKELRRIRRELLPTMRPGSNSRAYNWEWLEALQVENLLDCVEAGVTAALERKESRGCHIRKDYPEVNHDQYIKRFILKKDEDNFSLRARPPIVTELALPTGCHPNIMQYFLDPKIGYKKR